MARTTATYCRICEALCGLTATVENGRIVKLLPDPANPQSKGSACAKGLAMIGVQDDPDRILHPLRRKGRAGEFERIGWDEALDDIAKRLSTLRKKKGPKSLAVFSGNPPAFSFSAVLWMKGFQHAIGTPWYYGVNSEDGAARVAATAILYGSPAALPIPDLQRTQFLLMLGANPWVSRGSLINDPCIREHIDGIVERGGRVVVVDPRRTETARRFEHLAIRPGTDAWLLLSILNVIFEHHLEDATFIERWTSGVDAIQEACRRFPPEVTAGITCVPADTVREVAVAFASAPSAVVYGRTGTCTQAFGTLANILQDVINIVTGNFCRPGGWVFGWSPIPVAEMSERMRLATYDSVRTRVAGLPDSFGFLPSSALPDEITMPGEGRIRGLVLIGGNPVLSGPSGNALASALEELEIFVSLDLYQSETNRYADYILPITTMYERADVALQFLDRMTRPSLQVTDAVVEPAGESREEWRVLNDIAHRMGLGGAYSAAPLRWLARLGLEVTPKQIADLLIRTSSVGDLFGIRRSGLSWRKLIEQHPHGIVLRDPLPICAPAEKIRHADKRIPFADLRIVRELRRLEATDGRPSAEYPLRLIGLRETRSHNSWMHNVARLMPDTRAQAARIHPDDAAQLGIRSGQSIRIRSATATITVPAEATPEMMPGCIALPHGWGHHGGWRRANAAGGANSNLLASRHAADIEPLAAMTVLNGLPVHVEAAVEPSPPLSTREPG